MKIIGTNRDSECMYCGSKSYGRACVYAPSKTHVHVDDPKRCIYCGSKSLGSTCPLNPFGKNHQRGINYNPVMIESLENGIIQGIVMNKLSKPIEEYQAYRLGLIDKHGNVTREPITIVERKAMTGVDKYLIKVKTLVKERLEILNLTLYYENKNADTIEDIAELYPVELLCKDEISECVAKLASIASEYYAKGVSSSKFEQMIVEAMAHEHKI